MICLIVYRNFLKYISECLSNKSILIRYGLSVITLYRITLNNTIHILFSSPMVLYMKLLQQFLARDINALCMYSREFCYFELLHGKG